MFWMAFPTTTTLFCLLASTATRRRGSSSSRRLVSSLVHNKPRAAVISSSSMRAAASADNSSNNDTTTTTPHHQKDLGQLWAGAYNCWVNVPPPGLPSSSSSSQQKFLYLSPLLLQNNDDETKRQGQVVAEWPAAILQMLQRRHSSSSSSSILELTAYNPLGEELPLAQNRQANARLEQELRDLVKKSSCSNNCLWPSFGFRRAWQEHGFCIVVGDDDNDKLRTAVLDLARKYQQGAIYEYVLLDDDLEDDADAAAAGNSNNHDPVVVVRHTVPVLLLDKKNVEASVRVVPCRKPQMPESEPDYATRVDGQAIASVVFGHDDAIV